MNKAIGILALTLVAAAKHPFVGEHENSLFVNHPNGKVVSARLKPKKGRPYTPHKFVTTNDKRHMTLYEAATETVFGKSFKRFKFEAEVDAAFKPKKHTQTAHGKHKLKAAFKVEIDGGQLGFTYVGPIQMG